MLSFLIENNVFILLIIGLIGGVISGLLGVGGGIVTVPALFFLFSHKGFDPALTMHISVATSLCVMIVTSLSGARAHFKRHSVSLKVLKEMAPYLILGVAIGGITSKFYSTTILLSLFAVLATISAIRLGFFPQQPKSEDGQVHIEDYRHFKIKFTMTIIGFLSALMGIGGGTFTVPLMVLLGASVHIAIGTSVVFSLFIGIVGSIGFILSGYPFLGISWPYLGFIKLDVVFWLSLSSYFGAILGVSLAHRLNHLILQRAFAFFLIIAALKMGSSIFM